MHSNKKLKQGRLLLWLPGSVLVILTALLIYFLIIAIDHPPFVRDLSSLSIPRVKAGEEAFYSGNNWLRKSECGLWEMYLEGDAFERGVAFGQLTRELLFYQETAFVEQIQELVPSTSYLQFLKYFIAWFNRNLDENIPEEYKLEIYGTSLFCSPAYNFIGSGYQRQLNYHAAHDIGHALQGLNLVGCTSFASWGGKTADSSLIVGRNFDFYAGKKFAENKIVCFINPSKGYKFMMITWADMVGVVSGMNEKGLTVTINAAKSAIPGQAKTPVTILAREILQYASSIEEAFDIAKKRKLFVSESLLIGSQQDNMAAIIERSPDQYDIVYPASDMIVCANHFQGKKFSNDPRNIDNIKGSDSNYRFKRMNQLLNDESLINAEDAVTILRDRNGLHGTELGLGNPLAINQLIAHHSVIFKPDQLMVWISTSPYQLGKFVAYDLKKVFSMNRETVFAQREIYEEELTISPDTFVYSNDFHGFMKYLEMTEKLHLFEMSADPLPDSFEMDYIKTNPNLYLAYFNLGEYYRSVKNFEKAGEFYQKALTREVAGENQRKKLEHLLQKSLNQ